MKVFVTGGSGFIGSHLVRNLLREGHSVVAPARREEASARLRAAGADSPVIDYADAPSVRSAMDGCDAVVHVAACLSMWGPWEEFMAGNVTLTRQVLEATRVSRVARFVHISAASVIMDKSAPITGADESWPLTQNRKLPYSATKAIAESEVLDARSATMTTIVLRPPFVWGCGDAVDGDLGDQVRKGRFAWIAQGRYRYSTCHVENLCHAITLALGVDVSGVFFITDDEDITLRDFMTSRLQASGLNPPALSVPVSVAWLFAVCLEALWLAVRFRGEPPLTREMVRLIGYPFSVDITAARERLGYVPQVSIGEGIIRCSR